MLSLYLTKKMEYEVAIPLKAPSISCVFGQTGSGKTEWCVKLIQNANFVYSKPVKKIMYCYMVWQEAFDRMLKIRPDIEFHKGIPTSDDLDNLVAAAPDEHYLLFLDDLQSIIFDSKHMIDLVCVKSHHNRISTVFILQNIFGGGRYAKSITLQSQYLIAFKSMRDQSQLGTISRQIFGTGKQGVIPEVMRDVMSKEPYGYVMIDLTPNIDDSLRIRTKILPNELMAVYKVVK